MASNNSAAQDQSMEEILQSIKRIIADEETTPQKPTVSEENLVVEEVSSAVSNDILELSDIIEEITPPKSKEIFSTSILTAADSDFSFNNNDNTSIYSPTIISDNDTTSDMAINENEASELTNEIPPPEAEDINHQELENLSAQNIDNYMNNLSIAEENPIDSQTALLEIPSKSELLGDIDRLLSANAASGATSAFRALAEKAANRNPKPVEKPVIISKTTVEDLIIEFMRPMLQEWVNENLPQTVERIVKQEIRKLSESA